MPQDSCAHDGLPRPRPYVDSCTGSIRRVRYRCGPGPGPVAFAADVALSVGLIGIHFDFEDMGPSATVGRPECAYLLVKTTVRSMVSVYIACVPVHSRANHDTS